MTERRKLWILVLCCIGQFMVILDVSVVNVALPSIRSGLHFSAADLQWVVNAYTLTFAGFLLLGGRACDLLVRRHVFNFGMGLFVLTFGIVKTESYGWGSARTLITLGIAVALLALFLLIETRFASAPLMPISIFRSRQLSGANVVVLLLGASAFAMWYFLSLYLQEVRGFSPIKTGLAFLPGTLALAATAQMAGKRLHNLG